jgi:hypothetical protein
MQMWMIDEWTPRVSGQVSSPLLREHRPRQARLAASGAARPWQGDAREEGERGEQHGGGGLDADRG